MIYTDFGEFELIQNYRDAFVLDDFIHRYVECFDRYMYIVGDYSSGLLRLKGFSEKLNEIKERYIELLSRIPDVKFICPNSSPNVLSVAFLGVKASSLQNALENDVIIGKGSACTSRSSKVSHVLDALNLPLNIAESTVRLSFGAFNTIEEIDLAV